MTYDEMLEQLRSARPANFAAPTLAAKALPSGAGLSTREVALIDGLARAIHEEIQSEIAKAVAPLHAEITRLKTLTASRPPAGERWGHGDARGPTSYPSDNYWRQ
jgi:hypothetical protein